MLFLQLGIFFLLNGYEIFVTGTLRWRWRLLQLCAHDGVIIYLSCCGEPVVIVP